MESRTSIEEVLGVHNEVSSCACMGGRRTGETPLHRGFPSMNPGVDRCSEVGIEEESGPHVVLVLNVFDDDVDLRTIIPAHLVLIHLREHLTDVGLRNLWKAACQI